MYNNVRTVTKTKHGNSERLGSISPLLFMAVMLALTCEAREGCMWEYC